MARIKVTIGLTSSINSYRTTYEDLPDDWNDMTKFEQEDYLESVWEDATTTLLDGGVSVTDD